MTDEDKKRRRFVQGPLNNKIEEYNQKVDESKTLPQIDPNSIPSDATLESMKQHVNSVLPGGNFRKQLLNMLEQVKEDDEFVPGQGGDINDQWRGFE